MRPAITLEAFVYCLVSEQLVAGTYFKFSLLHGDEWKSTFFLFVFTTEDMFFHACFSTGT